MIDASRAVGVASKLMDEKGRDAYMGEIGADYEVMAKNYASKTKPRSKIEVARANQIGS